MYYINNALQHACICVAVLVVFDVATAKPISIVLGFPRGLKHTIHAKSLNILPISNFDAKNAPSSGSLRDIERMLYTLYIYF